MKVAVLGLGVEGLRAAESLKRRGHSVYASDIREDVNADLEGVDVDLGFHDMERIESADAVALSPSMMGTEIAERFNKKLLCKVLDDHRRIPTVLVTGTNGKTTTASMIAHVLRESGRRVLLGGNAGGGFQGYTEIFLRASEEKFDYIVVEVCDMTLEFASRCFNPSLVVLTNIGQDHMDFHDSLENYRRSVQKFLSGMNVIISADEPHLEELTADASWVREYRDYTGELLLEGRFNRKNAGAALEALRFLGVPEDALRKYLANFKPVKGRVRSFTINGSKVTIGKTDNPHALRAVLSEGPFDVMFIGTPRRSETWRFRILDEVLSSPPEVLVLFPGLEDTVDEAMEYLGDPGSMRVLRVDDAGRIPEMILEFSGKYRRILVGGNGQERITAIQEELEGLMDHDLPSSDC
ncbi:UDP-N-acetylmuramyl tripeptide synthetase related protein {ECO:0000313/EMBL:AAB85038,1} [Methanothermobacter wolfeii]|uniref:Mur ligase family protein n=1 Tax=Methanothermobacter wolfeii TaxID=145261 RepID=A0A9E7UFK3_METWO|nr:MULTISPECIES: Mur ligase family protein [Methanothermobacter]NLM02935.1 UDP-N-acetylmuramyl peptide synthase [Methanothermobacter wolfeii]QHN06364.1 UDP-N-acetylmuramyl peptide synthase [Methanothermobacter sp. THM-1]UXH30844.1 Mur ligase family protein [Methanothermobacter wolfeii]SCM57123.1 UDP-N-acetylmuramyl tripeptide synthetase related protein {ECO:0000313/EMBL:AAB85038,1} [Methanothermobacter wolfeii]